MIQSSDSSIPLLRGNVERRKALQALQVLVAVEGMKSCLRVILLLGAILFVFGALVIGFGFLLGLGW